VEVPVRPFRLLPAVAALALALPFTVTAPAAALAVPAASDPGIPSPYANPLDLRLPGDAQAESCADPDVLQVPATGAGPATWYLYCTTDALTDERDQSGALVFHTIPMYSSTDLTHWAYVGDAFPTQPAWVTGGVWAPEISYRDGRYLLYYTASETRRPDGSAGGGSAIGVAVSDSPTGPFVDTGIAVVEPAASGRWQFDAEVVTTDDASYVYFGGIFARQLAPDGLTSLPATETPIAIDNRYEGTVMVEHDGWWYFLGSATNCCNGPLTGYAVFAARSRSPLGPFVDRAGVSLLAGRVGGTPVLAQNGNRWVGTGHNTVFTDFSGQDWTIYHAVDSANPYYAGEVGYTKRPALLDPLDWKDGWPVVRGGFGPSDEPQPGPAAQPGQVGAYEPEFLPPVRVGKRFAALTDNFGGKRLSGQWTWVRPEAAEFTLDHSRLIWQTQAADLHPPAAPLASVLTEPAPAGDYVVDTRVTMSTPAEGCCQNYVQGGLVIYGDDGNYVKLASVSIVNTRQTEFGKNVSPVPAGYPGYGNTVVGPAGASTWLRIVHRDGLYTAYTSLDGRRWDTGGTWAHDLGATPRIGLVSLGGAGFTSSFDWVRVSALR
jgi:arabinan endo-1,5-alpha-L-arabinosidase